MKRAILILIICLVSAAFARAQSGGAYAKFNSAGATVGLYNLLPDATGCEASRTFSGAITKFDFTIGDAVYGVSFTINAAGKRSAFNFAVADDEILQPDTEDLIVKNRRVRVRARQCGSGGIWTATEIRRL